MWIPFGSWALDGLMQVRAERMVDRLLLLLPHKWTEHILAAVCPALVAAALVRLAKSGHSPSAAQAWVASLGRPQDYVSFERVADE